MLRVLRVLRLARLLRLLRLARLFRYMGKLLHVHTTCRLPVLTLATGRALRGGSQLQPRAYSETIFSPVAFRTLERMFDLLGSNAGLAGAKLGG